MEKLNMTQIQIMSTNLAKEILEAYAAGYYFDDLDHPNLNKDVISREIDMSRDEVICNWAKLCSFDEYDSLLENPNIYKNIYDEAFDKALRAVLDILY